MSSTTGPESPQGTPSTAVLHGRVALVTAGPEADGGSVVNITTATLTDLPAGSALYTASKSALATLTVVAAKELAPRGIRVNAVAPTATRTERTQEYAGPPAEARLIESIPLGRGWAPPLTSATPWCSSPPTPPGSSPPTPCTSPAARSDSSGLLGPAPSTSRPDSPRPIRPPLVLPPPQKQGPS